MVEIQAPAYSQRPSAQDRSAAEADEPRKPPLEIGRMVPLFGDESALPATEDGPRITLKPGHWTSTWQRMQANFNDFVGRLNVELLDDDRRGVPLANTEFTLEIARDVTLAKGKERQAQTDVLLPQGLPVERLQTRIIDRNSGAEVFLYQPRIEAMPAYQYHLVVLAKEPARYTFLKTTNTVRAPWEEEFDPSSSAHYQVTLAKAGAMVPVPENTLAWTDVAYLFWDEVDPTRLSVGQQQAITTWVHWGGRLIINGPDSLALLQGSFLDDYLPADDDGPRSITADQLEGWSDYWGRRDNGTPIPPLAPAEPISAIQLAPRPEAFPLQGSTTLFYGRTVGRGTIIVSAMQLSERALINWPGYDSFLNAGLLGRPRRQFTTGPYGAAQAAWADFPSRRLDAHFTTPLRLFARDAQVAANTAQVPHDQAGPFVTSGYTADRPGGVAAWDEHSRIANAARESLLVAAGVQVPGVAFVIGCLAFYLLILVPINWFIFHTIERVEWAWFAVPVLAIAGTWAVVKQAQLDIGFVRSQTEVAVLDLHGSYDRGWLSRFTAMYSSLATTYSVEFPDNISAAALPFPASDSDTPTGRQPVVFEEGASPRLDGLTVSSSATRLIHAEQLVALEGSLRWGKSSQGITQVENSTDLTLRDAAVIRRRFNRQGEPMYEGCWLGEIKPKSSVVVGMRPVSWEEDRLPFADDRSRDAQRRLTEVMDVTPILSLACTFTDKHDPLGSQREETRLVAVVDGALPGMNVTPEASQRAGATVVIAHLAFGPGPAAQPDVNSPADVIAVKTDNPEPL